MGGQSGILGAIPGYGSFARSSTAETMGSNGLYSTAAINVPRYDFGPDGVTPGWLLETEDQTNLIIKNRDIGDAAWTENASVASSSSQSSLDGLTNGSRIKDDLTNAAHSVSQTTSAVLVNQVRYTACCWLYRSANNFCQLFESNDSSYAFFDLENLTVGDTGGSIDDAAIIQSPDSNWVLCLMYFKNVGGGTTDLHIRGATGTTIGDEIFTGTDTTMFWIWCPMVVNGQIVSPIYTDGVAVTRSRDELTLTASEFSTINKSVFRMDATVWGFGVSGTFNVVSEADTPTTNAFNYYFPNDNQVNNLSYDDASTLDITIHQYGTAKVFGDRFIVHGERRQGARVLDSVRRNGVEQVVTGTIGGNTLIHDATPDILMYQNASGRFVPVTLHSLELG